MSRDLAERVRALSDASEGRGDWLVGWQAACEAVVALLAESTPAAHEHLPEYPSTCTGCEHLAADLAARLPVGLRSTPAAPDYGTVRSWNGSPSEPPPLPPLTPFAVTPAAPDFRRSPGPGGDPMYVTHGPSPSLLERLAREAHGKGYVDSPHVYYAGPGIHDEPRYEHYPFEVCPAPHCAEARTLLAESTPAAPDEEGRPPLDPATKAYDDGYMAGYRDGKARAAAPDEEGLDAAWAAAATAIDRIAAALNDCDWTGPTQIRHGDWNAFIDAWLRLRALASQDKP